MNYFVSTSGSDITGDGLSVSTAWRTINKAITSMPHIDEYHNVYVEKGVYRLDDEGGEIGIGNTHPIGSYEKYAKFYGDVKGEFFGTKGIVRITACDSSEQRQCRTYINIYSTYIEFWYMQFDGHEDQATYGQLSSFQSIFPTVSLHKCNVYNCGLIYNFRFYDCLIQKASRARYNCSYIIGSYHERCIIISTFIGPNSGTHLFYNCIFIGGEHYSSYCRYVNCIAVGMYKAFGNVNSNSINNVAISCTYSYPHATEAKDSISIDCEYHFYYAVCNNCYWSGLYYSTTGSSGTLTHGYDQGLLRMDYNKLIEAFAPLQGIFLRNKGCRDITVMDNDIRGLPQNSVDGSGIDVGAYRVDTIVEDVDNHSLEIEREGIKILTLPCKAGIETTITCDIESTGTTSRPEIRIYDQDGTLIDSDTAEGDSDSLSVTITPESDYIYRVWLYATDSTEGASTIFSNIQINSVDAMINDKGEIYPVIARMEDVNIVTIPNLWDNIENTIKIIRFHDNLVSTITLAAAIDYYPSFDFNQEHVNPLDPIEVDQIDRFHRDKINVKAIVSPANYNELYDALEDYDQIFIEFNLGETVKQYEITRILSMPVLIDIGRKYVSGTEMTFEATYFNALPYSFDSYRFTLHNVAFV